MDLQSNFQLCGAMNAIPRYNRGKYNRAAYADKYKRYRNIAISGLQRYRTYKDMHTAGTVVARR